MKICIIGTGYGGSCFPKDTKALYCQIEYATVESSNTLVIATGWNQFRNLDLTKIIKLLKSPILLDLRNLNELKKAKEIGFVYKGVRR